MIFRRSGQIIRRKTRLISDGRFAKIALECRDAQPHGLRVFRASEGKATMEILAVGENNERAGVEATAGRVG
jgi:hypothetical protein